MFEQALTTAPARLSGLATFDQVQLPPLSARQRQIVSFALRYVGYPYVWGGTWPTAASPFGRQAHGGFDCSGFVWWVLKLNFGYAIPNGQRTAAAMAAHAKPRIPWPSSSPATSSSSRRRARSRARARSSTPASTWATAGLPSPRAPSMASPSATWTGRAGTTVPTSPGGGECSRPRSWPPAPLRDGRSLGTVLGGRFTACAPAVSGVAGSAPAPPPCAGWLAQLAPGEPRRLFE